MSATVGIVGLIFVFPSVLPAKSYSSIKIMGGHSSLGEKNQTIADLVQRDSDGDSIPDWEEALWGTDKNKSQTFNDIPDATYIANKKKELNIAQSINTTTLTETEKFAREFFSGFTAMKASGQVDANTINNFSDALGQKIINPTLIDSFVATDIKIDEGDNANGSVQKQLYYGKVKNLFENYRSAGIGDELDIVNSGLASYGTSNNAVQFSKLSAISGAYRDFAKKMMDIKVPSDLASYHLQIANSSSNTGISVQNMAEVINDPLVGLEGLSQYQKYSEDLVKAVTDLETAISQ